MMRRSNSSCLSVASIPFNSSDVRSRNIFGRTVSLSYDHLPRHETGVDGQLVMRQAKRLAGILFIHSHQFKQNMAGFTTATHSSGMPFPLPMRVSAGFLVIGLWGISG